MTRAGAMGAALALFWAPIASAQSPAPSAQPDPRPDPSLHRGPHRSPGVLGALDPATGVFTPDAASPFTGSNVQGTLNIVYNLDASKVSTVSVLCSVQASGYLYDSSDDTTYQYSKNFVNGYYPNYDSKTSKFTGSEPIPFNFKSPYTGTYSIDVMVTCVYLDTNTTVYEGTYTIPVHAGDNFVSVGGSMNGTSF